MQTPSPVKEKVELRPLTPMLPPVEKLVPPVVQVPVVKVPPPRSVVATPAALPEPVAPPPELPPLPPPPTQLPQFIMQFVGQDWFHKSFPGIARKVSQNVNYLS